MSVRRQGEGALRRHRVLHQHPGGDTANGITDFIPAGQSCAVAIDGAKVLAIIDEPSTGPNTKADSARLPAEDLREHPWPCALNPLTASLINGSIQFKGDVTVFDAIAGSIDADAGFEAEVGLKWVDKATGGQIVTPFLFGEPDVDLSLLAWILSFLLGFITLGAVGGIITMVVLSLADDLAETLGGAIIKDEVTGQVKAIGAWPQTARGNRRGQLPLR